MVFDDLAYDYGKDVIYCYPNTSVLKNNFGIQDAKKLDEVERDFTFLKSTDLDKTPMPGELNFDYLRQIHRILFEDLYDWAGEIRKVDISKGNTFCLHEYIEENARVLFEQLKSKNFLSGVSFDDLPSRIAYYFGEVNTLHPFREGNGRSQRQFFRELASRLGYNLNFTKISKSEMIEASDAAFRCNYEPLEKIIARSLEPKEE